MNELTVEPPKQEESKLAVVVRRNGLPEDLALALAKQFDHFSAEADKWAKQAETIKVTDVNDVRGMKLARESRLALREVRINVENKRKDMKADSMRYGQAVDEVARMIKERIEPIETMLLEQEKFAEIKAEEARRERIKVRHEAIVEAGGNAAIYNVGDMTEPEFQALLGAVKSQKEAEERAAREAEAARIKREEEAKAERERQRIEHERLIAEREQLRLANEAKEKQIAEERAAARAAADKAQADAAAERKRLDAKHTAELKRQEAILEEEAQAKRKAEAEKASREFEARLKKQREEAEAERKRISEANRIERERIAKEAQEDRDRRDKEQFELAAKREAEAKAAQEHADKLAKELEEAKKEQPGRTHFVPGGNAHPVPSDPEGHRYEALKKLVIAFLDSVKGPRAGQTEALAALKAAVFPPDQLL